MKVGQNYLLLKNGTKIGQKTCNSPLNDIQIQQIERANVNLKKKHNIYHE